MSEGFISFTWEGEPIEDPRQWAKDRKMEFVRVLHKIPERVNPFTGLKTPASSREIDMPRIFYDNIRMSGGESYELLICLAENNS